MLTQTFTVNSFDDILKNITSYFVKLVV